MLLPQIRTTSAFRYLFSESPVLSGPELQGNPAESDGILKVTLAGLVIGELSQLCKMF